MCSKQIYKTLDCLHILVLVVCDTNMIIVKKEKKKKEA